MFKHIINYYIILMILNEQYGKGKPLSLRRPLFLVCRAFGLPMIALVSISSPRLGYVTREKKL